MTAILFATAAGLAVLAVRARRLDPGTYLGEPIATRARPDRRRGLPAGAVYGAGVGLAAVPTGSASPMALVVAGVVIGVIAARLAAGIRSQRRSRRLSQELPTVADTLALHVLAGEPTTGAIRRLVAATRGIAAAELAAALRDADGLEAGLRRRAGLAGPDAARLFDLLAHAHRTGGRLAESLGELAADYRAGLAAELTAEGGRRALASYGPILAFMVPVTLVFLMYPTLTGLSALSSRP